MGEKTIIAINRETGTRYGLEPYNQPQRQPFASGEFGDTASTVAAGSALTKNKQRVEAEEAARRQINRP